MICEIVRDEGFLAQRSAEASFLDISIAEPFIHYPDFAMMFLLGIPLYMGIFV